MKTSLLLSLGLTALVSSASTAYAADDKPLSNVLGGTFSGTIGLTSDYAFRGISQTQEAPAIQGNIDFNHASGFKAGFWGSNVDFGPAGDASMELDLYGGYAKTFGKLSLEGGVIYYAYPGASSGHNYDYTELYSITSYDFGPVALTGSLNYSPNFGLDSGTAWYPRMAVKVPLPANFALNAWIGHQYIEDNAKFGLRDYNDWATAVSYTIEGFTLQAQYTDTNLSKNDCAGSDICGARGILSLTKAF